MTEVFGASTADVDTDFALPAQPPAIIRFAELANTASRSAVRELHSSAGDVIHYCDELASRTSVVDDDQLTWLRRLSHGDRVLDIARDFGYSERSMYREFRKLWKLLQVNNRSEAIAVAAERGWLI